MNDAIARELRTSIDKLNRLMEKQLRQQKEDGLRRWRDANPKLSGRCKQAVAALNKVQRQLLEEILDAVENPEECLNTFMMHEFLDKYGPKLVNFQNMFQILVQLGG